MLSTSTTLKQDKALKAIAVWSGGKDSCLAYCRALKSGYQITDLLNFTVKDSKRSCFHGIANDFLALQAEQIGLPLFQKEVSAGMKDYEKNFKEAVSKFKSEGIERAVFGDIYINGYSNWVERVCQELEIEAIEPLWGQDTEDLFKEFIDYGFKAIVVSCRSELFPKEFIGRCLDKDILDELKRRKICPCGENGEFHTFVVDGPIFKKKIEITQSQAIFKEGFWKYWFLDIKGCQLKDREGR
ncbi:MAG: diphthine--ammonia ligase [Omnitrophica bacterium]|nr:diphthine--ammonia ligase [Candidatus Omnitrophota bacterium]